MYHTFIPCPVYSQCLEFISQEENHLLKSCFVNVSGKGRSWGKAKRPHFLLRNAFLSFEAANCKHKHRKEMFSQKMTMTLSPDTPSDSDNKVTNGKKMLFNPGIATRFSCKNVAYILATCIIRRKWDSSSPNYSFIMLTIAITIWSKILSNANASKR